MTVPLLYVVEVLLEFASLEPFPAGRGCRRPRLHHLLEQNVHAHEHRLGLHHDGAGRLGRAGIEVLVHAVVVDDGDVARFPVVANAVMNLVAFAVEDVEGRLVDVAVLLRMTARRVLLEVDVKHLRDTILRLDVMTAVRLGAIVEPDQAPLPHARHRSKTRELVFQVVGTGNRANEDAVLLAVIVRLADDHFVGNPRAFHLFSHGQVSVADLTRSALRYRITPRTCLTETCPVSAPGTTRGSIPPVAARFRRPPPSTG